MTGVPQRPTHGLRAERARPLTKRQREVMEFIETFLRDRGYPPAYTDVMAAFDFASKYSVRCHVRSLVNAGYLEVDKYMARGMRVLRSVLPVEPTVREGSSSTLHDCADESADDQGTG